MYLQDTYIVMHIYTPYTYKHIMRLWPIQHQFFAMVASMASSLDASLSYLSPKARDKENDSQNGNRDVQDVLSCSRKTLSLGSLGDRIRAERSRAQREPESSFVVNSPEALPCTSQILPPQHLWTPNFTSPNSEEAQGANRETRWWQEKWYTLRYFTLDTGWELN